jgi:hypothetical protein
MLFLVDRRAPLRLLTENVCRGVGEALGNLNAAEQIVEPDTTTQVEGCSFKSRTVEGFSRLFPSCRVNSTVMRLDTLTNRVRGVIHVNN